MVNIRYFQPCDAEKLWHLKFQTVREINSKDYSFEQVVAWAPTQYDKAAWFARISSINPFVIEVNSVIAAYADLQDNGHIEHFYCGKDFIGRGIGAHLMRHILQKARKKGISKLYSDVSITARPFFEHFGFSVISPQTVEIDNVKLRNYSMRLNINTHGD